MRISKVAQLEVINDDFEFAESGSGVFPACSAQLRIACPECGGPVTYTEVNGTWGWDQHDTGCIDSELAEYGVARARPCIFVDCRQNLYADVTVVGNIKLNFPDREPEQLEDSCALDLAEEGGVTLSKAAYALNLTPEGVRQLEVNALRRLKQGIDDDG